MAPGYSVKHLSEIPRVPKTAQGDPDWHAVQYYFSLSAYGANAYVAAEPGTQLIGDHDEVRSGQEELYFVSAGTARFTLDGEEVKATAGTFVAVRNPKVRRAAIAERAGTTIVAIGAKPTGAFVSTWDRRHFEDVPHT